MYEPRTATVVGTIVKNGPNTRANMRVRICACSDVLIASTSVLATKSIPTSGRYTRPAVGIALRWPLILSAGRSATSSTPTAKISAVSQGKCPSGAKPSAARNARPYADHAAPASMIGSAQRPVSGVSSVGSGAAKKLPAPPQQRQLDRRHEAEDDHPFQPREPPLGAALDRLWQQSGRVADDRHDHDRDHVPQVKSHHIVVGTRQHPLDARPQRAIERRREG